MTKCIRKEFLLAIFVILFVASIGLIIWNNGQVDLQNCINGKSLQANIDVSTGQFIIQIKKSEPVENVFSLLDSYGLSYSDILSLSDVNYLKVYVPSGDEFKWMCILEKQDYITKSDFDRLMHGT